MSEYEVWYDADTDELFLTTDFYPWQRNLLTEILNWHYIGEL